MIHVKEPFRATTKLAFSYAEMKRLIERMPLDDVRKEMEKQMFGIDNALAVLIDTLDELWRNQKEAKE